VLVLLLNIYSSAVTSPCLITKEVRMNDVVIIRTVMRHFHIPHTHTCCTTDTIASIIYDVVLHDYYNIGGINAISNYVLYIGATPSDYITVYVLGT